MQKYVVCSCSCINYVAFFFQLCCIFISYDAEFRLRCVGGSLRFEGLKFELPHHYSWGWGVGNVSQRVIKSP